MRMIAGERMRMMARERKRNSREGGRMRMMARWRENENVCGREREN